MTIFDATSRPMACRLSLHHTWQLRTNPDGERYRQCGRCGKDQSPRHRGPYDWTAGFGL